MVAEKCKKWLLKCKKLSDLMAAVEVLRLVHYHYRTAWKGKLVYIGVALHLALIRSEDGSVHSIRGGQFLCMHSV